MNIDRIMARLTDLSSANAFNPYSDRCPIHDLADAPEIRRRNLERVIRAATDQGVDEIWIALEPTYRGARRTGLAMTDELHLYEHGRRFGIEDLTTATVSPGPNEDTARIIWQALDGLPRRVFLWNTVPLHTHKPGKPFSIRRHSAAERNASKPVLHSILDLLAPRRLIAIGWEAGRALRDTGIEVHKVRHPARGGGARFTEQVLGC